MRVNIAHARCLVFANAFLVVTASYVTEVPLGLSVVSGVLNLVAALLVAAGVWQFARPFVRFDVSGVESADSTGATRGFESAGNDGGLESAADNGGFEGAEDD